MAPKTPLNVQSFPRPPLLERTSRHLLIKHKNQIIAETTSAFWVLETYHPPTYYLPIASLKLPLTKTPNKTTLCEWKGWASYYSITLPSEEGEVEVKDRIWSYENPNKKFEEIKDHMSFYVGPWECYVDGELVQPQPGDFYGGWTTSELTGLIKGDKETRWL